MSRRVKLTQIVLSFIAIALVASLFLGGLVGGRNQDPPASTSTTGPQTPSAIPEGEPLLVLVEDDFAKVLGQALRRRLPDRRLICIDSIQAIPGDYLDLGRPLMGGLAIPVVVKTLIFG